jgi:tetratricopeptide (TPR) repeat protein
MSKNKYLLMICIFLTIATLLAFWQVNHCDFVHYDDNIYVTKNDQTQKGISLEGIRWAFTTGHTGNWHPLTWISHMLDVQLFGLQPRWHHLTNLLFHLANTLLLFFVLQRMTKARWESAFVAALFALHPLHVESVAWVAERKDVLSAFFWMLTMGAYCLYVEQPRLPRYLLVVLFFGLGLMAKPMLVTLPFVLLLLDYWPLQRLQQITSDRKTRAAIHKPVSGEKQKGRRSRQRNTGEQNVKVEIPAGPLYQWALIRPLLWEKIPLFALAALSSIVTYLVQQKGGAVISFLPLGTRILNAFNSYITYIGQTIWPHDLAVLYPYPGLLPTWQVLGAVLLLVAITVLVIWKAGRIPPLVVGWLWYVGTLVPVIGIVQVGYQARADRYTYLPLIGLFIMVAWGISEFSKNWRSRKEVLFAASTVIFVCLGIVTWRQIGHWQNSITLFDHALNVTENNSIAYNNRGHAFNQRGKDKQAIRDFDSAIEINPGYAEAHYNRGISYWHLGNDRQALVDYGKAIEISPIYVDAYNNRGHVLAALGNDKQAIGDFNKALSIKPGHAISFFNRGLSYWNLGNDKQAIGDFDKAIELNPKYAEAHNMLGIIHAALGNDGKAIGKYDTAIEIDPNYALAHYNRGNTYLHLGDYDKAIGDYDKAIEIKQNYAGAYNNRAYAYWRLGNHRQSNEDLKTAARLGYENAQNTLKSKGLGW